MTLVYEWGALLLDLAKDSRGTKAKYKRLAELTTELVAEGLLTEEEAEIILT